MSRSLPLASGHRRGAGCAVPKSPGPRAPGALQCSRNAREYLPGSAGPRRRPARLDRVRLPWGAQSAEQPCSDCCSRAEAPSHSTSRPGNGAGARNQLYCCAWECGSASLSAARPEPIPARSKPLARLVSARERAAPAFQSPRQTPSTLDMPPAARQWCAPGNRRRPSHRRRCLADPSASAPWPPAGLPWWPPGRWTTPPLRLLPATRGPRPQSMQRRLVPRPAATPPAWSCWCSTSSARAPSPLTQRTGDSCKAAAVRQSPPSYWGQWRNIEGLPPRAEPALPSLHCRESGLQRQGAMAAATAP